MDKKPYRAIVGKQVVTKEGKKLGVIKDITFEAKTGGQICKSESQVKDLQTEKTKIIKDKLTTGFSNEVDIYFDRGFFYTDYKITAKWSLKNNKPVVIFDFSPQKVTNIQTSFSDYLPFITAQVDLKNKKISQDDLDEIGKLLESSTAEYFSANLNTIINLDRTRLFKDDSGSNKPLPIEKVNDLLYGIDEIPK